MNKAVQIKISLTKELSEKVDKRATTLGVPVTQFVKYLILKDVDADYPTYLASEETIQDAEEASGEYDKAVPFEAIFK